MNDITLSSWIVMSTFVACREPNLDEREETHTLSDLITKRLKHAFLFRVIRRGQWIVQLPVHEFGSRERGTFVSGTVTQRDHKIEAEVHNVLRCFRCSSLQVNTDLFHDLDRERVNISAFDTSARYFKML
jgi:hypothetical protein